MQMIDITTLHDEERQVLIHTDNSSVFSGPVSEARKRFPELFNDTALESSPADAPSPFESRP